MVFKGLHFTMRTRRISSSNLSREEVLDVIFQDGDFEMSEVTDGESNFES